MDVQKVKLLSDMYIGWAHCLNQRTSTGYSCVVW